MLLQHSLTLLTAGAAFLPAVIAQPYPITGVYVDPRAGSVPLRKNINDFQAEGGAQWDLYLLALTAMQNDNFQNQLSYFQVAGIHGRPYIEWNNAGGPQSNDWMGYCPHGEGLFLPWHRPYVVLFEQVLVQKARDIANTYPARVRGDYLRAAETLRSPYWDWAADSRVPPATVARTFRVRVPNGQALEDRVIANPLAAYQFPRDVLNGAYGPFDPQNRQQISRCPAPQSFPDSANRLLAARPYRRWTYDVFTRAQSYEDFASTGTSGVSLEQIHNGIHWDAACGGHFISSDFSAFDPLFMLHHTNIDRLWAYWQAMWPQFAIFQTSYWGGARFSTPRGTAIGPDSPLQPFFQQDGQFHTTRSVGNIARFGYAYVGLEWWAKSPQQMAQDARALINRAYAPQTGLRAASNGDNKAHKKTRFFVNLSVNVTEVERPATVDVFVAGEKVGNMVLMQQPTAGTIHGGFSLDDVLAKSGKSKPTIDSIKSTLQVDITKLNGDKIPLESVPSLEVEVEEGVVEPPKEQAGLPMFNSTRQEPATPKEKENISRLR